MARRFQARKRARRLSEPLCWRLLNEARKPARMLGFRNSVFSLYPRLYPHPCLATNQTACGVRIARSAPPQKKHLLALGQSANPSKPTNPTIRPWTTWFKNWAAVFSLARASTVGKPFKAYKPHQPARPAGLRIGPQLFHWLTFRRKKTPQNPPNPPNASDSFELRPSEPGCSAIVRKENQHYGHHNDLAPRSAGQS